MNDFRRFAPAPLPNSSSGRGWRQLVSQYHSFVSSDLYPIELLCQPRTVQTRLPAFTSDLDELAVSELRLKLNPLIIDRAVESEDAVVLHVDLLLVDLFEREGSELVLVGLLSLVLSVGPIEPTVGTNRVVGHHTFEVLGLPLNSVGSSSNSGSSIDSWTWT